LNCRLCRNGRLIRSKDFSRGFGLLLSGFEHAFLAAADALVRVQTLEDELRGGNLLLGTFFLRNAQRAEFVDQALNFFQFSSASTPRSESDN
jgi:hypothetical protein